MPVDGGLFLVWEMETTSIVRSDEDAERYVENFASFADAITR
jgi:hypothetical protein